MGEHVVCGVDAHDAWLDCRIGVDREAPGRKRFQNNPEGRCDLFEHLGLLVGKHGGAKVMVGYEASPLGYGLYDDCRDNGVECVILAPTKIARSVEDRKRKTDDRDATRIFEALRAHVLAGNELPAIWIPDVETRDDRETLRARIDLTEKLTRLKAQVRMLLKRNRVEKPEEVRATWTIPYRAWVAALELRPGAQSWLSSVTGNVRQPSPISMGVPKSARARMKTISPAANSVGARRGTTIRKNLLGPEQPRLSLASSSELSTFSSAPLT